MALASSRVIRSSAPVNTTVLPATGEEALTARQRHDLDMAEKVVDHFHVVGFAEEFDDGVADDRADAADR